MELLISAVPIFLFGAGAYYIIKLKGFFIIHPKKTFSALFVRRGSGSVSPARALSMALAGTLGVGNIVGVASALYLGGAGAIFWMVLSAIVAMVLKYAEIVLAVRYREAGEDGVPVGGAPFYIKVCFNKIGLNRLGAVLAALFSLLCVFNALTMGNILQVNSVAGAFEEAFGVPRLLCGVVLALFCAVVMVGGAKGIANLTAKLVPLITVLFVILCLAVVIARRERLGDAVYSIFSDALGFDSAAGGVLGYLLSGGFLRSSGLRYGTMRGLLSNEAGCGTAPIAHATADTDSPAAQGVFGLVEVFVDTVLMCTLTALAILVSDAGFGGGYMAFGDNSMQCVQAAFSSVLGEWASGFLAVAVLLFGVATVLCQSHYGMPCVRYLSNSKPARVTYTAVFCGVIVVGAMAATGSVFALGDIALALMTYINLAVLIMMGKEVGRETDLLIK